MLALRRNTELAAESVADFKYDTFQSILMPALKILIGTQGSLADAVLYESGALTFSFANGTGANGLDAGVEASSQWYALYAVPNASNSGYMLKASTSAPHAAGGSGPVGFTKYRYLGLFRNGTNHWDATNSSYGLGDIARFTKSGQQLTFQSFSSNNGGSFGAISGMFGLVLFVANSAVDGTVVDFGNANYFGFAGANPQGGVKLPYRDALMRYCYQAVNSPAWIEFRDSGGGNIRMYHTAPIINTVPRGIFWHQNLAADPTWAPLLQTKINGNPNVSRCLLLEVIIDPYVLGEF